MRLRITFSIALVVLLVATAIAVTAFKPQSDQKNKQTVVAQQLPSENGLIPVEIRSRRADFKSPSAVENISFVVRNNTNKDISALCLAYSIILERDGVESRDTFFWLLNHLSTRTFVKGVV